MPTASATRQSPQTEISRFIANCPGGDSARILSLQAVDGFRGRFGALSLPRKSRFPTAGTGVDGDWFEECWVSATEGRPRQ